MPRPIYTPTNCPNPAYQLDWTYHAFWRENSRDCAWLAELQRLCEVDGIRILQASRVKAHCLSRAAIVPDHIHLTLGCSLENSPEEIVLAYLNNLAHVCGMKPVFKYSYFVGTFSEYDLGVIPRP